MKKKKIIKGVVVGTLIPSILVPSCTSSYFLDDMSIMDINRSKSYDARHSIAVPIDLNLKSNDQKLLNFISKLAQDIMKNPLIAKQFAEDPQSIAKTYGVQDLKIDFDDEFWKLIVALGDEDLHNAAKTNNTSLFFSLCSEKGLLSELEKSELAKYLDESIGVIDDGEIKPSSSAVVAAVIGALIAGVGVNTVGYDTFMVYETTYFWDRSESSSAIRQGDRLAFQVWALKNGKQNTHIMLSKYQEKIVDDCINAIQKHFPEKIEGVDIAELRQIIALNMPK